MLVSEQVLTLSNKVGVLTNKAYSCAPALVSDLQGLSTDLRGLYEAVLEIEPSREDLRAVEERLRRYPSLVATIAEGRPEWWRIAWEIDHPTSDPCAERVQGGASVALAQRIAEAKDQLDRQVGQALEDAMTEVMAIDSALDRLPRRMRRLLEMRYFDGACWYEIAEEIGVTRQWAIELRDEALTLLAMELQNVS